MKIIVTYTCIVLNLIFWNSVKWMLGFCKRCLEKITKRNIVILWWCNFPLSHWPKPSLWTTSSSTFKIATLWFISMYVLKFLAWKVWIFLKYSWASGVLLQNNIFDEWNYCILSRVWMQCFEINFIWFYVSLCGLKYWYFV